MVKIIGSIVIAFLLLATLTFAKDFTLEAIQYQLEQDYPAIEHIEQEALNHMQAGNSAAQMLIFDVREPGEFAVSHIKGAIRLDPSSYRTPFMKKWGKTLKGKTIIFYCSVGVRSTKMANYLKEDLKSSGVKKIYNLKQGLFAWANGARPMINKNGNTPFIHPYDDHWGSLLKSKYLWQKFPQ